MWKIQRSVGIIYMLIASLAFAIMGVFVKRLSKDFDTVEIVFFRNLFGVLVLGISYFKAPFSLKGQKPALLMFRGLVGTMSLYAFAYTLTHLTLGEAFTFYQTSTLFIAAFSFFILKEKLDTRALLALIIGFCGILVIFRPDIGSNWFNNLMGLTNGVLSAAAYLAVSNLKKYYDTRAIVLAFMGWGVIIPVISMLIGTYIELPDLRFMIAPFKMPQWHHSIDIIMVGATAVLGQIYVTKAFGAEKAGIVSAISYSNVIFSIGLGVLIGDRFPDTLSLLGISMIIMSGLLISLRKEA